MNVGRKVSSKQSVSSVDSSFLQKFISPFPAVCFLGRVSLCIVSLALGEKVAYKGTLPKWHMAVGKEVI